MIPLTSIEDARKYLHARAAHFGVPAHIRDGLIEFILQARPLGGFLEAVMDDKLVESFSRADNENIAGMFNTASFIYNEVPMDCRGKNRKTWRGIFPIEKEQ